MSRISPDMDIRDAILEAGGTDAYRCYQCGKCMAVCPWCHVDSVVFPVYRVPQSVRFGAMMASEDPEEIEREATEVYRCVGCESCSTWCPHEVRMPDIMRAIRRILVEFDSYPAELKDSVGRIQSSGNPYGEPQEKRLDWAEGLEVPIFSTEMDYLSFTCCAAAHDPRVREAAKATVDVLRAADVTFGLLGEREVCCSEAIRRAGAEEVFQETAGANLEGIRQAGALRVLTTSPHCYSSFNRDYKELGADFEPVHQTQLFDELITAERIAPTKELGKRVAYHDPCTLGRLSGVYDEPRRVLQSIPGLEMVEIACFNREHSLCCGGGSGGVWLERPKGERMSDIRVRQAADTGADILAVACPYCLQMFSDSVRTMELELEVKDVAELLAQSL